jgi:hypothetical protein
MPFPGPPPAKGLFIPPPDPDPNGFVIPLPDPDPPEDGLKGLFIPAPEPLPPLIGLNGPPLPDFSPLLPPPLFAPDPPLPPPIVCITTNEYMYLFSKFVDRVMGFNATFNSILAILRRSVLLVEVTEVHGENHRPVASN